MIALIACAVLIALIATAAAISATPLYRTLSAAIDSWADSVQGETTRLR